MGRQHNKKSGRFYQRRIPVKYSGRAIFRIIAGIREFSRQKNKVKRRITPVRFYGDSSC